MAARWVRGRPPTFRGVGAVSSLGATTMKRRAGRPEISSIDTAARNVQYVSMLLLDREKQMLLKNTEVLLRLAAPTRFDRQRHLWFRATDRRWQRLSCLWDKTPADIKYRSKNIMQGRLNNDPNGATPLDIFILVGCLHWSCFISVSTPRTLSKGHVQLFPCPIKRIQTNAARKWKSCHLIG